MYTPAHFAEPRHDELVALIKAHPLGCVVTHGADGFDANHLPFEHHPKPGMPGTLAAHIARANPLIEIARAGADVMVVFRGHAGYISPSWYPSKHEHHKMVPTWNYEVVHAHGRLRLVDDERFLRGVLARLTRQHEAAEAKPWKMGDAPPDYVQQMVAMVAGIEIELTRLDGKKKLSQNREARDAQGAVDALHARGHEALADAMTKARAVAPSPAGGRGLG
jgi:transcriptional regulator